MKRLLFILPFALLFSFSGINVPKNSKSILITSQSQLEIKGTSNVTDFKCGYEIQNLEQPIIVLYEKTDNTIQFEKSKLVLKNMDFDCGGKGINKDFHGLLKTEIYPTITLQLKEVKLNPDKKNKADALIEIEIAGISNSYFMETDFVKNENWLISGEMKLNIQDFNLKAPKKMLGLVVVSNDIEIVFKLDLKEC